MKPRKQRDYHHTPYARKLRQTQTDAEARLWQYLRNRHLANAKFRRQVPLGPYIVDFVCFAHKLCIELDGNQHAEPENETYDVERTAFLNSQGLRVVRFPNHDVLSNTEGVLVMIKAILDAPERFDELVERFELQ